MTGWAALRTELDRWRGTGRRASFWWRDDDTSEPSAALTRLIALADAKGLPLALAVIPAAAGDALAAALPKRPGLQLLQHGYSHRNHAPATEKKMELGPHRPRREIARELGQGRKRLDALFGRRFVPALVPPWNRIDADLLPRLAGLGFTGLSTFRARAARQPAPGLLQVNCHIDIVDWRTRRFAGERAALGQAIGHLAARREGRADPAEPTGLMTHHLAQDAAAWRFLVRFLEATSGHPAARWLSARQVFRDGGRAA